MNEGKYYGYLQNAVTANSSKGNPQIVLSWNVTHQDVNGEYVEMPAPLAVRLFWSLTDKAAPYSLEKLDRVGFTGDFGNPTFDEQITANGAELCCRQEVYDGKSRDRWDLAPTGGDVEPASAEVCRKLTAMYRARMKVAKTPPPVAPKAEAPADGDPIPF